MPGEATQKGVNKRRQPPVSNIEACYAAFCKRQDRACRGSHYADPAGEVKPNKDGLASKLRAWQRWRRGPTGLTRLDGSRLLRIFKGPGGYLWSVSPDGMISHERYSNEDKALQSLEEYLASHPEQPQQSPPIEVT
jgi:hypothetical protein